MQMITTAFFSFFTETQGQAISIVPNVQNLTIISDPFPDLSATILPEVQTVNISLWVTDQHCGWAFQNFLVKVNCPDRGTFLPMPSTVSVPYSQATPFLKQFQFDYIFSGGTVLRTQVGSNLAQITITDAPIGSSYSIGDVFFGNTTFIPTVAGLYSISVIYNTGCGADYVYTYTWTASCSDFAQTTLAVSPSSTSVAFTDRQNVRMDVGYINWASGYDSNTIYAREWVVTAAPNTSIYYPFDRFETLDTNTTLATYSVTNNATSTTNVTTITVSSAYVRYLRRVTLQEEHDNSYSIFPVCFRPDVGGNYAVSFFLHLTNADGVNVCSVSSSASISVACTANGPVLDTVTSFTTTVARFKPSRVWLNASTVTDLDTPTKDLLFLWEVVYPTSTSIDTRDGTLLTVPTIIEPTSQITSFNAPQANIDYVIKLSVSDRCHLSTKLITIKALCDITINLANRTLVATYDGTVPVPLMSFGYDHTKEIADFLPAPRLSKLFMVIR